VTTARLDAMAAALFAAHGARSAPALVYGFPGTVLLSVNEEIVHGVPGGRVLAAGDLVKLDVTVEKDGYVADALVACAEAAFRAALPVACTGTLVSEIGRAVEREVRRRGFHVVPELAGHGVGRTIHEPPTVPNPTSVTC
jgi:methionyl aminopeptidase